MKTTIYILSFLLTITITYTACKKEETKPLGSLNNTNNSTNTSENGTALIHLHTYIDAEEVDGYNIDYTSVSGRKIALSMAQFYLSEFQVEKLDGTLIDIPNKKALKILELDSYVIGDVPAGNYKSLRFKVGLPPATNAELPSNSADSTLLKHNEMWFSNTAQPNGYIFFNAQGSIDTSSDISHKMCPFVYKIGTNTNYKQVIINQNFGISPNGTAYVHLIADYSKLFNGFTLDPAHLNVSTASDNSSATAIQIANNISSMFSTE